MSITKLKKAFQESCNLFLFALNITLILICLFSIGYNALLLVFMPFDWAQLAYLILSVIGLFAVFILTFYFSD